MEVGYGSWVSSYAVMEGVATVEEATFAGSVFWITNTIARVILIYITWKISDRLKILLGGMIVGCVINMVAAFTNYQWFAAFPGSFLNGFFLASLFALYLSLPGEYGYLLSKRNTANFMMCSTFGEGVIAMPIGYAMGIYGPWILYVAELGFAIISLVLVRKLIVEFEIGSKAEYLNPKVEEVEVSDNE